MKEYNKHNIPLAQKLRKEQTKWERKLWYGFLNKYPLRFQRQKAIGDYIIDFYCAKAKIAIELDGYYHSNEKQSCIDINRDDYLKDVGIEVIRFKNSEIDNEFEKVCRKIDAMVRRKRREDQEL